MKKEDKEKRKFKTAKILITIAVIVILAIFLWQLAPLITKLSTEEGQIAFKNKINSMGFNGILLLFGLQVLQILLVVLPGEPFEVLAGMCYGAWGRIFIYYNICFNYKYNYIFYSKKIRKKIFI